MLRWLLLAAVVLAADLATKAWAASAVPYGSIEPVLPMLAWTHLHNTGAAFSFLAGAGGWQRWALAALAVGFSALLLWELKRLGRSDPWQGAAYGLILGGALGNLHDRLRLGYVEDFILVYHGDWRFPAFNIADSAISVGAAIWIVLLLREWLQARQADPNS